MRQMQLLSKFRTHVKCTQIAWHSINDIDVMLGVMCRPFFCFLVTFFVIGGVASHAEESAVYLGMHMHNADTTTRWPAVGFQSWRLWDAHVAWPNIEPMRDRWSFEKLDRYLAMARITKVEVLLPLGLSPAWASARPNERSSYSPGNASEPALLTDWTVYVDTVVRRYAGRIAAYEIWNEPNADGFFSGSTAEMVKLTCAAYRTIKLADPSAIVLSPAATHQEQGVQWLDEFLSLGGGACIDAVAFHFYTLAHEPPEALIPLVAKVRAVMAKRNVSGMPLWNTESGWFIANSHGPAKVKWKVLDSDEAAAFVARALIIGKSLELARFYWYAWDDGILGLLEMEDATPKQAAFAYRTTAKWLQGVNTVRCEKLNTLLMACTLGERIKGSHVVWSTGTEATLVIPAAWGVTQQRELISDELKPIDGGSIRVRQQPILLQPSADQ